MSKSSKGKPRERRLDFGSIAIDPDKHGGKAYLKYSDITVQEVLDLIKAGKSDEAICDIFNRHASNDNAPHKKNNKNAAEKAREKARDKAAQDKGIDTRPMSKNKIDACRAYQAWKNPGALKSVFNKASKGNMVMLDENMSYRMLPNIVKLFGRSTHVVFEGLVGKHNDDEKDIWKHVVDNDFKLVITGDDDFIGIAMRHHKKKKIERKEPVPPGLLPTVIFIPSALRSSRAQTMHYLDKYQNQIRRFMEKRDAVYAELTPQGLKKVGKLHKSSNDNKKPPLSQRGNGPKPS